MTDFKLVAKASGCCIYEKDEQIIVKEQPGLWMITASFVLLLISAIPIIFGISTLYMHFQSKEISLTLGLGFLGVGVLFGFIFILIRKQSKKINEMHPSQYKTICIFDLKDNYLLDSSGTKLDSFDNVLVGRDFQFTSSAKKLVVRYTNGSITLANGNPFAGGITKLEKPFIKLGLMK